VLVANSLLLEAALIVDDSIASTVCGSSVGVCKQGMNVCNNGVTTCVGIGGDPIIGTVCVDCLAAFERDKETAAVVLVVVGGARYLLMGGHHDPAEYLKRLDDPNLVQQLDEVVGTVLDEIKPARGQRAAVTRHGQVMHRGELRRI